MSFWKRAVNVWTVEGLEGGMTGWSEADGVGRVGGISSARTTVQDVNPDSRDPGA